MASNGSTNGLAADSGVASGVVSGVTLVTAPAVDSAPEPRDPRERHELIDSIQRTVRRQLAYYDRLRTQTVQLGVGRGQALHGAIERVWESVLALSLALDFQELQGGWRQEPEPDHAPPPEICTACDREIGRAEVAHVFDDRCVCMACYCRLKAERDRTAAHEMTVARPPTEQQLAYARDLGLNAPPQVTYRQMAELIKTFLTRPAPPPVLHEAAVMQIPQAGEMPWRLLKRRLDERYMVLCWVYSVCRHMLGAEWRDYADSRLPHNVVMPIVTELAAREDTVGAIRNHPAAPTAGRGDDANGSANGNGSTEAEGCNGCWFAFAHGDRENGVYQTTRRLIERELWAYLPHLPRSADAGRNGRQG